MKQKTYILIILVLLATLLAVPAKAEDAQQSRKLQIKAAFVYNFIRFVDWPEEKMPDNDEPVVIGVIGNKDFIKAFEPMKNKQARGKNIVIKHFEHIDTAKQSASQKKAAQEQFIEELKKCHILLLCDCNTVTADDKTKLIEALKDSPVLMVSGKPGFLENGGHIRFLEKDQKIRFEINLDAAKRSGLKIRSKLLRLATRVINENTEGAEN